MKAYKSSNSLLIVASLIALMSATLSASAQTSTTTQQISNGQIVNNTQSLTGVQLIYTAPTNQQVVTEHSDFKAKLNGGSLSAMKTDMQSLLNTSIVNASDTQAKILAAQQAIRAPAPAPAPLPTTTLPPINFTPNFGSLNLSGTGIGSIGGLSFNFTGTNLSNLQSGSSTGWGYIPGF